MTTRPTYSRATTGLLLLGVALILCVAGMVYRGVQKNSVPHRQFLEIKAKAEQGDGKSQFSLAFCYFQGLGVEKDVAQGLEWYQSFTNHGINIAAAAARLSSRVE